MSKILVLNDREYEGAGNLQVIEFNFFEREINLSNYDALIFTSINGVKAIDRISDSWRELSSYAIGSATYAKLKELGANVVFSAKSSYGDDFADEIKSILASKRVLFVRPKVVTSKLNEILLSNGVLLDELVLYETKCVDNSKTSKPQKDSTIIFSSPSTIECFFRYFEWDDSYTAVVIGTKTASYMPPNIRYELSPKPNINEAIRFAQKLEMSLSNKGL